MLNTETIDVPSYTAGQWNTADQLCNWLNTLEDTNIEKTKVYEWAIRFRPTKEYYNRDR